MIMFLKQGKGRKSEHPVGMESNSKDRVKSSPIDTPSKIDMARLNGRQQRILSRLGEEGRMDPKEIYDLAPNVSTRTIRRDMDTLVGLGLVSQEGSTKATTYIFKG